MSFIIRENNLRLPASLFRQFRGREIDDVVEIDLLVFDGSRKFRNFSCFTSNPESVLHTFWSLNLEDRDFNKIYKIIFSDESTGKNYKCEMSRSVFRIDDDFQLPKKYSGVGNPHRKYSIEYWHHIKEEWMPLSSEFTMKSKKFIEGAWEMRKSIRLGSTAQYRMVKHENDKVITVNSLGDKH